MGKKSSQKGKKKEGVKKAAPEREKIFEEVKSGAERKWYLLLAVVGVVVLLVQLLCVPEARLDGGPVFDRDRLCPHRHDQGEDELGHFMKSPTAAATMVSVEAMSMASRRQRRLSMWLSLSSNEA